MIYLLTAVPMVLFIPWVFVNSSSTPRILAIGVGLYLAFMPGIRSESEASRPAFYFLAACLLSFLFAANHPIAFFGSPRAPYYGLVGIAMVIGAYCAGGGLAEDPRPILIKTGAVLGVLAVIQALVQVSFTGIELHSARAAVFRGSPVMFAASLLPCALCAWHFFRLRALSWENNWGILFILIVAGMFAAQAKGAILALVVGIWVYETNGWKRWAGVATFLALLGLYIGKVHTPTNLERIELLRISWISFLQRPWFGWGPDNFIIALVKNRTPAYDALVGKGVGQASAHQDLAQVAVTLGIVGLIAYLNLLWSLFRASYMSLGMAILVAMWFQAQVNPLPLDVLVVSALLIGYHQEGEGYLMPPGWLSPAILALTVFVAVMDLSPAAFRFLR